MRVTTLFDQLLFSITRVEVDRPEGSRGVGTAFIVRHELNPDLRADFLVTARHVVEAGGPGHVFFHLSEEGAVQLEKVYKMTVSNWQTAWHFHPDPRIDVAVSPMWSIIQKLKEDGVQIYVKPFPSALLASDSVMADLDSFEEVVFEGFPMGLSDASHLLPIARRGVTATPLAVDYNNLPAFLIDASVFWGSSGSPVLIANQGAYVNRKGLQFGTRVHVLGVLSQLFARKRSKEGVPQVVPISDDASASNADPVDLGLVFKAKTIVEAIESRWKKSSEPPPGTGEDSKA